MVSVLAYCKAIKLGGTEICNSHDNAVKIIAYNVTNFHPYEGVNVLSVYGGREKNSLFTSGTSSTYCGTFVQKVVPEGADEMHKVDVCLTGGLRK